MTFQSIVFIPGVDTTSTGPGPISVNRSPASPGGHQRGIMIGQAIDMATGIDHVLDFFVAPSWQDPSETVIEYSTFQNAGINNAGKTFLTVFVAP